MTDEQIQQLERYEESSVYNDLEKAVLRFAQQWTQQGKAEPELVQRLSQDLSSSQMVILAATVGLANWTNRFNETFAIELP